MKKVSRRAMLRGLGGVLISLPVLEGCSSFEGLASAPPRENPEVGSRREAMVETPAKRFIALMCPNGTEPRLWFPTGSETNFELNQHNSPLEPIKRHLVLTRGIDNKQAIDSLSLGLGNGHAEGVQSLLTGHLIEERPAGSNDWYVKGGPSIDQMLSDFFIESGYLGRSRGIHLGEEAPGAYSAISIQADGSREDYTWNTEVLFDSPGDQSQAALENARLRNKSVLDGSKSDFERLARRVSGEDKRRVDAHLEFLRSIEKRYAVATSCPAPALGQPMNDDERRDLIYDIITAAMACDSTRVATAVFRHSGGGGPQLPFVDVYEDIHELSHQVVGADLADASQAAFTRYHQWWSRKTLRMVENMKAITMPEGGTLFDDVVIFQGSEIAYDHWCPDMPFLILAGEKTPFRTGRYVEFRPRVMHTHLLTTLLNAFGHPATQVGDLRYAPGNLNAALFKS